MSQHIASEVVVIAAQAATEAESLINNNVVNDGFIRSALSDLKVASLSDELPDEVYERLRVVGMASVRLYQSFDEIPEADSFVSLCVEISNRLTSAT
jgi:hypothetical protein